MWSYSYSTQDMLDVKQQCNWSTIVVVEESVRNINLCQLSEARCLTLIQLITKKLEWQALKLSCSTIVPSCAYCAHQACSLAPKAVLVILSLYSVNSIERPCFSFWSRATTWLLTCDWICTTPNYQLGIWKEKQTSRNLLWNFNDMKVEVDLS